ncbi:MAG: hypothetical protein JO258_04665, partial [Alphaproteobacteria bacterium]|nr:hypothetical protein [Alphaproteobacteria bacterium]
MRNQAAAFFPSRLSLPLRAGRRNGAQVRQMGATMIAIFFARAQRARLSLEAIRQTNSRSAMGIGLSAAVALAALINVPAPAAALEYQQGPKVVGNPVSGAPEQGYAVAISADGNTAIVGALLDGLTASGSAFVYTRNGNQWTQQAKLVPQENGSSGSCGGTITRDFSVALSANGNTALIGSTNEDSTAGAVWVFFRNGNGIWSESQRLVPTDPAPACGTRLGGAVALSADGKTALISSTEDGSAVGAAWVFVQTGNGFNEQAKLIGAGNNGNSAQGYSLALSADGNTAILGGPGDSANAGAAWVFTRSGGLFGSWSPQGGKLIGSNASGAAQQGWSVALSADGNTALIGGPSDNSGVGAGWVFTRSGGNWTQQGAKVVVPNSVDLNQLGYSASLSTDGNTALLGAPGPSIANGGIGEGDIFVRNSGGVWTYRTQLRGVDAVGNAAQGSSAALSGDGDTAILGGPVDNNGVGAAWLFGFQTLTATHDFNGDHRSDILLRSSAGDVGLWTMNGGAFQGNVVGNVANVWSIVGQRDFAGRGESGILWRDTSGDVAMWLMRGNQVAGAAGFGPMPGNWS